MAATYWIKLYHEILRDPKMGRLPDRAWRRTIELFLLAGEMGSEGILPAVADMAWQLRIDEATLLEDMATLAEHGILTETEDGWLVTNFASRQGPVSDTERMSRYRERLRHAQYHGDAAVTNRNVDSDTESDTDSDTEAEPEAREDALAAGGAEDDVLAGALFTEVDQTGVLLNATLAEAWLDAIEDHRAWLTEQDVHDAFLAAAKANVPRPSPSYVRSILDRCKRENVRPGQERSNGHGARASPEQPVMTDAAMYLENALRGVD